MQYGNQGASASTPAPASPILGALDEVDVCVRELYDALDRLSSGIEIVSKPMPPSGASPGNLKEVSAVVSPLTERINGISKTLREATSRLHFARDRLEI